MFPAARSAFIITALETALGRRPSLISPAACVSYCRCFSHKLSQINYKNRTCCPEVLAGRGETEPAGPLARFCGPQSQRRQLNLIH